MALTVWEQRLGIGQNRVRNPTGATPPDGKHAIVLGEDLEGFIGNYEVGDFVKLEQTVDVTALQLITIGFAKLRTPSDITAESVAWEVSTLIGGVAAFTTRGYTGVLRDIPDMAIDVHALTGNQLIGVQLDLVVA